MKHGSRSLSSQITISHGDKQNDKLFFEYLANKLGLKDKDEWHKITKEDIVKEGGEGMLKKLYGGSVKVALQKMYPDHKWLVWKFDGHVQPGTWDDMKSQREFMHNLAKELRIETMDDWYHVTKEQIRDKGGGGLLNQKYHGSPSKMILSILTEHKWDLQKFVHTPRGAWQDPKVRKEMMEHLTRELKIVQMKDWYRVTQVQICEKGGRRLLTKYDGSPAKMIMSELPHHPWNLKKFTKITGIWHNREFQEEVNQNLAKNEITKTKSS
eukprot:TRINITY_DN641_c0_g1_i4.p1 TRINITY_DN641_c0_g1~~TRINITY_DN641_c0_g1_i4.p1  ORF type:complete len:268 (-),score=42.41 TRINITY_DN641_c0_g1_i4:35-838(-)